MPNGYHFTATPLSMKFSEVIISFIYCLEIRFVSFLETVLQISAFSLSFSLGMSAVSGGYYCWDGADSVVSAGVG